jgi:ribosomal protein S6--L-glutamate ligase
VERRYLAQAQPAGLIAELQAMGHRVSVVEDEATVLEVGRNGIWRGVDVVVSRGRSWSLLSLMASIEKHGIPTINRRSAIARVHNKAEMAVALEGVAPEAATFVGSPRSLARRVPGVCYPLLLKPIFGDNCRGIRLVRTREELESVAWAEPVALAQEYLDSGGRDLKLYGIGEEIWAVRKPSPLGDLGGGPPRAFEPERLELDPAHLRLGKKCRHLFGLDFFGVDCVETPEGPVVLEVNDFPSYTGIAEANRRLAEFVVRRAREEARE